MVRIHVVFSGHVQHCGFRYYTWKMVKKVGDITGWVKNIPDGKVEMEVQGSRGNVDRLMALIKKGTASIRVDQAEVTDIECVNDEKIYQVVREYRNYFATVK